MDRIRKFLRKLDRKTRLDVEAVVIKILRRDFAGLDIKKLKGAGHLFRVRVGSLRIIYIQDEKSTMVIAVERRSEKTYK